MFNQIKARLINKIKEDREYFEKKMEENIPIGKELINEKSYYLSEKIKDYSNNELSKINEIKENLSSTLKNSNNNYLQLLSNSENDFENIKNNIYDNILFEIEDLKKKAKINRLSNEDLKTIENDFKYNLTLSLNNFNNDYQKNLDNLKDDVKNKIKEIEENTNNKLYDLNNNYQNKSNEREKEKENLNKLINDEFNLVYNKLINSLSLIEEDFNIKNTENELDSKAFKIEIETNDKIGSFKENSLKDSEKVYNEINKSKEKISEKKDKILNEISKEINNEKKTLNNQIKELKNNEKEFSNNKKLFDDTFKEQKKEFNNVFNLFEKKLDLLKESFKDELNEINYSILKNDYSKNSNPIINSISSSIKDINNINSKIESEIEKADETRQLLLNSYNYYNYELDKDNIVSPEIIELEGNLKEENNEEEEEKKENDENNNNIDKEYRLIEPEIENEEQV
jgi:hypothetical protein